MRILILGSSGFLGSYLGFALPRWGHDVRGVSRSPVPYFPDNTVVAGLEEVRAIIEAEAFDVVVNCVALASHEACEKTPLLAEEVNATFPGIWAGEAERAGSKFVHISTDAVFDGNQPGLYREDDETNPGSIYGMTKVRGEKSVLVANPGALVLRVNFFGWSRGQNSGILDFFVNAFTQNSPITGFRDYVVSSLYMGHLAHAMIALVECNASGIFHAVSRTPLSKYDFGMLVSRCAELSSDSMTAGLLADATSLAPRGHNLSLSTDKIESVLGAPMPSTEDGVKSALAEREALMDYFGASEQ